MGYLSFPRHCHCRLRLNHWPHRRRLTALPSHIFLLYNAFYQASDKELQFVVTRSKPLSGKCQRVRALQLATYFSRFADGWERKSRRRPEKRTACNHKVSTCLRFFSLDSWMFHLPPYLLALSSHPGMNSSHRNHMYFMGNLTKTRLRLIFYKIGGYQAGGTVQVRRTGSTKAGGHGVPSL